MKERALVIVSQEKNPQLSFNKLREYLQHVILRELFEQGVLDNIVFHGGTALRILFDLRRFSEDLDFHTLNKNEFDLEKVVKKMMDHLPQQGYRVSVTTNFKGAVRSAFIKFNDLLSEMGLSRQKGEKLRVKIEVDTKPPEGYNTKSSLINKYFPFGFIHHDRASFLSGKLHAVLQHSYTKGRDFYDLWFYLSRWKDLSPNFQYLNNALKQTKYEGLSIKKENWKKVTSSKIKGIDWDYVVSDVEPFIENQNDLKVFSKKTMLELLK
ncbi:nucleotidyl transferase AbiEii/AbiGii toxin family protein [candidate division WOR-3 bacterium]|nr:nucleotidyl transferase AbiEii/AbiGii toxin family protein [candidate division WOR-3 bacterium]